MNLRDLCPDLTRTAARTTVAGLRWAVGGGRLSGALDMRIHRRRTNAPSGQPSFLATEHTPRMGPFGPAGSATQCMRAARRIRAHSEPWRRLCMHGHFSSVLYTQARGIGCICFLRVLDLHAMRPEASAESCFECF